MFRLCQSLRPTVVWSPGSLASEASSVDIRPWNCGGEGEVFAGLRAMVPLGKNGASVHMVLGRLQGSAPSSQERALAWALSLGLGPVGVSLTSNGGVRPEILQRPTISAPRLLRKRGS